MSILKTNQIQRVDGQPLLNTTGSIIQTVVMSTDTKATLNVTSFTEASSSYRVQITPTHADNRIHLSYHMMTNTDMASNTLFMLRAVKYTSGSAATITSRSTWSSAGSRYPVDFGARPLNGQDGNDQTPIYWECFDDPNSTSQQTYGFTYRREAGGSGTIYFGYSKNNNTIYAFHTNVMIIAREVVR